MRWTSDAMKKKQTWLVLPTGRTKRTETPSKNNETEITI